jgi:uncharacterized membrane protein
MFEKYEKPKPIEALADELEKITRSLSPSSSMQLGEEALNSDAVVTLVHQIGDICLNEKVHPAVAMTAFQILFRASIALLGEEEKHLLDTHLAEFGIELLSISVLKMVLGTSDKFKQEEGKDTDIILDLLEKMGTDQKENM